MQDSQNIMMLLGLLDLIFAHSVYAVYKRRSQQQRGTALSHKANLQDLGLMYSLPRTTFKTKLAL